MKKSLVALATLSLIGSAFADVDVSGGVKLYGVLDQAVTSQTYKTTSIAEANYTGLYASAATSRLGVKGSRDLGDGFKADILAEIQLDPQATQLLPNKNRSAWVGITNTDAGTIRLGTQETTAYEVFAGDVNGRVEYKPQLWRYTTTYREYTNGSTTYTDGLGTQDRANNAIKVISKDIGGFTVHAMVNFNGASASTAPADTNANISSTFSSLGLKYNSEKLKAAYVYDQLTNADGAWYLPGVSSGQVAAKGSATKWAAHSTTNPLTRNILTASYDFGSFSGSYIMANASVSGSGSMSTNTLGVSVPYDKFKFALSYGSGSIDSTTYTATSGTLTDTTFGTYYNFDKSTQAYLLYSQSTYSAVAGTSTTVAVGARYNF